MAQALATEADVKANVEPAVAFYFGPPERRLFGWYYAPRPSTRNKTRAVLLCSPIGYEALCAHAFYRYLAERLSAAGHAVLRFDYDGTGDSVGSDDDPDRVASWTASIGSAIDTLRARSRQAEVALFGLRLGATLATVAASQRGDVSRLMLWAACRGGRSYLRELRLFRAAHRGAETVSSQSERNAYEEAAGFYLNPNTVDDLIGLDGSTIQSCPAAKVLLIGRDDIRPDEKLRSRLVDLGCEISTSQWTGFASMMQDPQETEIPVAAVDAVTEWLSDSTANDVVVGTRLPPADLSHAGRLETLKYIEEPLITEGDPATFSVLTLPKDGVDTSRPAVLLLSVGANPHVGPSRMYVTLARHLASTGFTVARVDVPGIGDSSTGCASARRCIYSPSAKYAIQAIMQTLQHTRGVENFVVAGLCSGAYTAYKLAATDSRIAGQVLINPQTFEWSEGDSIEVRLRQSYRLTSHYVRAMFDRRTLMRVLAMQVDVSGIARILLRRSLDRIRLISRDILRRVIQRQPFDTAVCHDFREISRRGARTLFVFAASDFGIEATAHHLGPKARKLNLYNTVQYREIEDADHTFTQKDAREKLIAGIQQFIETNFPPLSDSFVERRF